MDKLNQSIFTFNSVLAVVNSELQTMRDKFCGKHVVMYFLFDEDDKEYGVVEDITYNGIELLIHVTYDSGWHGIFYVNDNRVIYLDENRND